jgi:hypothetical protein
MALATIPGSPSTWLYYVDESHDAEKHCLIALGVRADQWRESYESIKKLRAELKNEYSIRTNVEFHARDLVAGRGKLAQDRKGGRIVLDRSTCAVIYEKILRTITRLPSIHMFNICLETKGYRDTELVAWDRLLNRLNRTAEERNRREEQQRTRILGEARPNIDATTYRRLRNRLTPYSAQVIVIADEGRQFDIRRLRRQKAVINYVPSRFQSWPTGESTKNIPLLHFVEDALFRDSKDSQFVQMADCAAYALLKRETTPIKWISDLGINLLWDKHLRDIRFDKAALDDPDGIVRK